VLQRVKLILTLYRCFSK